MFYNYAVNGLNHIVDDKALIVADSLEAIHDELAKRRIRANDSTPVFANTFTVETDLALYKPFTRHSRPKIKFDLPGVKFHPLFNHYAIIHGPPGDRRVEWLHHNQLWYAPIQDCLHDLQKDFLENVNEQIYKNPVSKISIPLDGIIIPHPL